ncbi:hypothetical protein B0T16DRAFT_451200 [Cercophora newfieldiana]|uniref:Uncharacterized protein n=1 Tax=Cercophora newfieldiana TaxID=92897 RepID=A0AA39YN22_9PEZI|nr:hypothetical protein B0T16DRAFT_451200 [Cercophora newfieldiana]
MALDDLLQRETIERDERDERDDAADADAEPNSYSSCCITAGCTDGNVYVWDTAQGDRPIHILLSHGESMEEMLGNREMADVGVKFTAWG